MEEQLLLSVKMELLLPVDEISHKLSPELQLEAAQKSKQKEIIYQGESLQGFLVVKLPEANRSQGRAIDDWQQYYTNLSLSLQLLNPQHAETAAAAPQRKTSHAPGAASQLQPALIPATSLAKAGTLAGATSVMGEGHEDNMVGAWVGAAGPGLILPNRAVLYRFESAVAVEATIFNKPVTLRLLVSPPSFPLDEASFPMPFALNPPRAEATARSVHGVYMRHIASKGLRPTLTLDRRLHVMDPLLITAHVTSLGGDVLLSLSLCNRRPDNAPLSVHSVRIQARDGRAVPCHWLGGAGPEDGGGSGSEALGGVRGVEVEGGGAVSVACVVKSSELGEGPGRRLVLWWRGEGVRGSKAGGGWVMRLFSMESLLEMASNPERDTVQVSFHCAPKVAVGERKEVEVGVLNLGATGRRLALRMEAEAAEEGSARGDGVMSCLVREVEVGLVGPGEQVRVFLPVLGVRRGVAALAGLVAVDGDKGVRLPLRAEWVAQVVDPV